MKRFSLSAEERIRNKKEFDRIYLSGKTLYSKDKKLKAVYLYDRKFGKEGIKIAVAVSKKAGSAVWRNRVKRMIKESYRLSKNLILPDVQEMKITLSIIFSPYYLNAKTKRIISLNNIISPIKELLNKIKKEILSEYHS